MRTDRTPAAASFAITFWRVASVYWLHVQWNWTPTVVPAVGFWACVAAPAEATAQQKRTAMGAMRGPIGRQGNASDGRFTPPKG